MSGPAVDVAQLDEEANLGIYELAYLCGKGDRVAQVVLVALLADGQVEVACKRQRVEPTDEEAAPDDAIEVAALELLPDTGSTVAEFVELIADCAAVAGLAATLRRRGVRRRQLGLFATKAYRRLLADPGRGPHRVAVLGTAAIEDTRLRAVLENPLPSVPSIRPHQQIPSNEIDGETIGPNRDAMSGGSVLIS